MNNWKKEGLLVEEKRKAKRIPLEGNLAMNRLDGGKAEIVPVQIVDVSKTGIGFECARDLSIGSLYALELVLWTKEKIDTLIEKKSNYTKDASIIIDFDRYKPWSGAVATYDKIVNANKLDDLEAMIDELYPDGINETALNDWLWFDGDELLKELNIIDEMNDGDLEEEIGMDRDLDDLSKEEQIEKVSKDYDVSKEQAKRVIEKMDKNGVTIKFEKTASAY